jgi:hypothetical protein
MKETRQLNNVDHDEESALFHERRSSKNEKNPSNDIPYITTTAASSSVNNINHEGSVTNRSGTVPHRKGLGGKETKAVSFLRLVVLAVLVVSATCTAIAVYFYTRNSELRSFKDSYLDDASHLTRGFGKSLYVMMGAIDSYALHLVTDAHDTKQVFPFVTVPNAPLHFSKLDSIASTIMVQQAYFVTSEQRMEWENYTDNNNQWINQDILLQNHDVDFSVNSTDLTPTTMNRTVESSIHNSDGPSIGNGPFLPTWQCYPIIPGKTFILDCVCIHTFTINPHVSYYCECVYFVKVQAFIILMH